MTGCIQREPPVLALLANTIKRSDNDGWRNHCAPLEITVSTEKMLIGATVDLLPALVKKSGRVSHPKLRPGVPTSTTICLSPFALLGD